MNEILKARLKLEEGSKKNAQGRYIIYPDSLGIPTLGYGRNTTNGFSQDEVDLMLENDGDEAELQCNDRFPWLANLSPIRQSVILDIVFNEGIERFLGFKKMIGFLEAGDFVNAKQELLYTDGKPTPYYQEVGHRAEDLADLLVSG